MEDRDSASRFITLIDEMYNHNVKLYCSSNVKIEDLNPDLNSKKVKTHTNIDEDFYDHHVFNEEFALERIKSRIVEM